MSGIDEIRALATSCHRVGSRVTCNPAPDDTDEDWLILISAEKSAAFDKLINGLGYEAGGSDIPDEVNKVEPENRFYAYRLDETNLIITLSPRFHQRFLAATSVAKRLNLLEKADRIALFQAVLYGNECLPSDAQLAAEGALDPVF